ncbi:hypothetical protein HIM_03793 [Hirsutella minnesotensis 3608]|uniref:Protein SIP5 n=1 Tax=Hirsutella minnesotensis 3608 TaxID=1043627 RepID=A0A0F7ZM24_9HYPO|nr:hypothetical protein HIM_03793 [Hirsutella minnesotensis 3608]
MGNANTKEARPGEHPEAHPEGRGESNRSRNRISRSDLGSFLSFQSTSRDRERERQNAPFERRETRQEREARRLERDRVARAKERERSMREEHVDGGFLVTLGTYTGIEDFNKPVVRQLQIERKLAPFWRGLNDWSSNWAEHQLVAAARGLPVPAADAPPDPALMPQPRSREPGASQNLGNFTVSMGPRTLSAASDRSEAGATPDVQSPAAAAPSRTASFKPRAKAIAAALSVSSRNASTTDLGPKEMSLPHDPFVNGQPIEVFLYKEASECPICFLSYPPYLNSTRCCDQPICSECFVQIKRVDPHLPEHHPDGQARDPNQGLTAEDPPEMLISEPSSCPYCQQPDFGVTYDPPPFRRGLVMSSVSSNMPSSTAMSSQSSLHSTPPPLSPHQPGRRRTHSLSASASNVITTDRVRPDWATKLAAARAHQARRAAAATALHTAAFLMGGNDQRSSFRASRFVRRSTGNGTNVPGAEHDGSGVSLGTSEAPEAGEEGGPASRNLGSRRRSRMEELEEMMFMEAVRLSLASEEDRKRKEEKAQRKEEKKRQQAERKAQKKQGKDPYGGGASGASRSSLSLGLGRLRGNSATSNSKVDAPAQGGSSISRSGSTGNIESQDRAEHPVGKGKGVDRPSLDTAGSGSSQVGCLGIPANMSRNGSHLRQISNASSLGSSAAESPSGSYVAPGLEATDSSNGQGAPRIEDDAGNEPMFNFRSLAELVGVDIENGSSQTGGHEQAGSPTSQADQSTQSRPLSRVNEEEKEGETEHVEDNQRTEPSEKTTPPTTSETTSHPAVTSLARQSPLDPATGEETRAATSEATNKVAAAPSASITMASPTAASVEEVATDHKSVGHSSVTERPSSTA